MKPVGKSYSDRIFSVVNGIVMAFVCIVIAYPLYHILLTSVTEPGAVQPGELLFYPKAFTLQAYRMILGNESVWAGYANTVKYTFFGTLVSLICTVPGAYALSRRELYGRRLIMFLFTFTMFFSGGMIPTFLTLKSLHMLDTTWAIILPQAVSAYNLIVCRSFYDNSIPEELRDAARIDGCSEFSYFFRIAVPLSKTIIAVIALFYANVLWNQYFNPLMFLTDEGKMPLMLFLSRVSNQSPMMEAGIVVVASAPLMMLYPFMQKFFAKGVAIGAIKG